jgi:hypothetical protein
VLFFAVVFRAAPLLAALLFAVPFVAAPLVAARLAELLLVRAEADLFAAVLRAPPFRVAVLTALAFFTDRVLLLLFAPAVRALVTLRDLAARGVALATR